MEAQWFIRSKSKCGMDSTLMCSCFVGRKGPGVKYPVAFPWDVCSCGSVVEHCVSSAKVVGSIPREHTY